MYLTWKTLCLDLPAAVESVIVNSAVHQVAKDENLGLTHLYCIPYDIKHKNTIHKLKICTHLAI